MDSTEGRLGSEVMLSIDGRLASDVIDETLRIEGTLAKLMSTGMLRTDSMAGSEAMLAVGGRLTTSGPPNFW